MTIRFVLLVLLAFAVLGHGPARGQQAPSGAGAGSSVVIDEQVKAEEIVPVRRYVVALDPGHGGQDLGVRSAKSILEKSVALKLAVSIKSMAARYPNVTALLTREGDLERSLLRRLEFANSKKADLFIGIHTGGGFSPQARPLEIFIPANKTKVADGEWNSLNRPHSRANRRLAEAVSKRLQRLDSNRDVRILPTDRMMLGGLAMPAAVIEPVDLSNPQDEIALEDQKRLDRIAHAITAGIMDFLDVKEPEPERETGDE